MSDIKEVLKKVKNSKLSLFDYSTTIGLVNKEIVKNIIRNKQIVHGAKAINAQVPFPSKRPTKDYDVFVKNPKKEAEKLDKILDKLRNGNYHYIKKALHPGTIKLRDVGPDLKINTEDDFTLVDFSPKPRRLKTKKINNILYSSLEEIKKTKIRTLNDPKLKFRHEKAKIDLLRINKALNKGGMFF